jgi:hypothetical protein
MVVWSSRSKLILVGLIARAAPLPSRSKGWLIPYAANDYARYGVWDAGSMLVKGNLRTCIK